MQIRWWWWGGGDDLTYMGGKVRKCKKRGKSELRLENWHPPTATVQFAIGNTKREIQNTKNI